MSLDVSLSCTVCFIQLQNRLNVQRGQLLKAQQNSLQVRHRHKDSVIENIAQLQSRDHHQAQRSAFASQRPKTARPVLENDRSIPRVREVDQKLVSVTLRPETHSAVDTNSSTATTVHQPPSLQPPVSVCRSVSSSSYGAEHFSHRMTADASVHSASPRTADAVSDSTETQNHQSSSLPLKPDVVKSSCPGNTYKMNYNSSVSQLSTENDVIRNNRPVNSQATESALPLVYMPPLTIAVTKTSNAVLSSPAGSPRYFARLDVLPLFEASVIDLCDVSTNGSSEETGSSSSVPLTKPNCAFASKSVIASTYLSRRPPVFSPISVETGFYSDDELSLPSSHVGRNGANYLTTADTAQCAVSPPTKLSDGKRSSFAKSSVPAVVSPEVPPRLSGNRDGQSVSHSSSSKLHGVLNNNRKVSHTALSSDVCDNAEIFASASSTENVCDGSSRTDANSLLVVATGPSTYVPFTTSSATDTSLVFSSVRSSKVPSNGNDSSALLSSKLPAPLSVNVASERLLPGTVSSTARPLPQVSASLLDVVERFPDRLSSSMVSPYSDTDMSTALADDITSSEITKFLQPGRLGRQPCAIPPTSTVPSVCYAMPCTLTISTHIPVSSPSIDTLTSSLNTTSSSVISDTVAVTVSSSWDPSSTTTAVDIMSTVVPSSSRLLQSSESSVELIETVRGEVYDHCLPLGVQDAPNARQFYTSSPPMTSRELTSDGTYVSHIFSAPSHAASDSLERIAIATVVDKTPEECNLNKQESIDDTAADFKEVEADALSDDASSDIVPLEGEPDPLPVVHTRVSKQKPYNGSKTLQRVSFSPLALLLDASLEGDLELVMSTAKKVS